jgi:hypothetical protein
MNAELVEVALEDCAEGYGCRREGFGWADRKVAAWALGGSSSRDGRDRDDTHDTDVGSAAPRDDHEPANRRDDLASDTAARPPRESAALFCTAISNALPTLSKHLRNA